MINKQRWLGTDEQRAELQAVLEVMSAERYVARIWDKDASLWTSEPSQQEKIESRLGWLRLPERCLPRVGELGQFADGICQEGFEHVVLLGMGGSCLGAWALERIVEARAGYPSLKVLDSTVPGEVLRVTESINPELTLFVVGSKSGATTEVLSFFEYFYGQILQIKGERAGENFVVITDQGSALAEIADQRGLRATFENWPDVGGRFSVLSYFGMLPAALAGLPIAQILEGGQAMAAACGPSVPPEQNPGLRLGALLGACYQLGRDKITLLTPAELDSFADWVEQLLAESTGKQGKGLVPVVREPLGEPEVYGDDRLFVHIHLAGDERLSSLVSELAQDGHPVIDIELSEANSIGQEMYRWEMGTAVAAARMGINPFDEPNVQESKDKTRQVLAEYAQAGQLPQFTPDVVEEPLSFCGAAGADSAAEALRQLFGQAQPGDYVAIMAYLPCTVHTEQVLAAIRGQIRDALRVPATLGYGPRFLHSTGQLHKGGPNTGLLIQLVAEDGSGVPIPGKEYDFATLKEAQALGDFAVLQQRGRRVLRIELGREVDRDLATLAKVASEALRNAPGDS